MAVTINPTRKTRVFKDLDLNFTAHPVTGDVVKRLDEEAIKRSVRNLVQTKNYERPFHPEIGSQIAGLLFEPFTPIINNLIRQTIVDTITNFEPRVQLLDVYVDGDGDNNEVFVRIEFKIVNTERPIVLDIILERTR